MRLGFRGHRRKHHQISHENYRKGGIVVMEYCAICSSESAEVVVKNVPQKYRGGEVEIPDVEMYHCNDCGEDFFTPEQSKTYSEKARSLGVPFKRKH